MSTKRAGAMADVEASPLTWFAELWFARQTGDREREAAARRQLRALGVDVLIDGGGPHQHAVQLAARRRGGAA